MAGSMDTKPTTGYMDVPMMVPSLGHSGQNFIGPILQPPSAPLQQQPLLEQTSWISEQNFTPPGRTPPNSTSGEPALQEPIPLTCLQVTAKNTPQSNALAPAYSIMMAGGVQIAWGLCFHFHRIEQFLDKSRYPETSHEIHLWKYGGWNDVLESDWSTNHSIISYFIGMLLGSIIATTTIHNIQKKIFYILSSALLIISGILSIFGATNYIVIIASRYIAGIAIGLSFIPFVFHASEITVKEIRGSRLGGLSMLMMAGMLLMLVGSGASFNRLERLNLHCGIFSIIYAVLAIILSLICGIESPIFHLAKGQNDLAKICLIRARNKRSETESIRTEFKELNGILEDQKLQNSNILLEGNYKPLIYVATLRVLYTVSISVPILHFLGDSLKDYSDNIIFASALIIFVRYLSEFVGFFMPDILSRRLLILISSGVGGISLILSGITYAVNDGNFGFAVFSCIYSAVIGFGLGSVSLCYLGELFPRRKKAVSCLDIVAIEILAQIIATSVSVYGYLPNIRTEAPFVVGVLQMIGAVFLYFNLPETKGLVLRQCYNQMKQKTSRFNVL